MDELQRAFYQLRIEVQYLKLTGESFQELFSSVMERCYPAGDFVRTRPWGKVGDRKNDGYLRSQRTLFQVYAPNELSSREAMKKIREDFSGALPFWEAHFDRWVFVHNAHRGLGPDVVQLLLELEKVESGRFRLSHWGLPEFIGECLNLPIQELENLFGLIPTQRDILNLGMAEIQPLLSQLERLPPQSEDLRPVPPGKLDYNLLSPSAKQLFKLGETKSNLVDRYYRSSLDPTVRDQHAAAFRTKYREFRAAGNAADDIFRLLQIYVSGDAPAGPAKQVAALAVLAHFFAACDIFERPEEA
jgi:hypothetical protein